MKNVVFLENARADVRNAFNWYEASSKGLGNRFTQQLIKSSQKISRGIIEYRKYTQDIQYLQMKGFPFSIFFTKELSGKIFIIAVLHNRQNISAIIDKRK